MNGAPAVPRQVWFYLLPAATVLLFGASLLLTFGLIQAQQRSFYEESRTGAWVVAQAGYEHQRFLRALDLYVHGDPEVNQDEFLQRFEIFWSRIPLLTVGQEAGYLRLIPEAPELKSRIEATLRRLEPVVTALEPGDLASYRVIRGEIEIFEAPLGALLRSLLRRSAFTQKHDVMLESIRFLRWAFYAVLALGLLISAFLIWQTMRRVRLQRDLEQAAFALRETNEQLERRVAARTAEVERQAAELESSLKAQIEFNALQREFVAMASHEFRTPLAIIDTSAQRISRRLNKLTPDQILERLGHIRDGVKRIEELIESTLSAGQLNAGKIELRPAATDLAKLLDGALRRHREISPSHRLTLDLRELPPQIDADPRLLDQILANLISNAVKYSPRKSRVEISAWTEGDRVAFAVCDQGVGIPDDELPRICQRYFRARTSVGIAGTGIGLNLVKEFVEMHGGTIDIRSTEGAGSTFTVRLPIRRDRGPCRPGVADPGTAYPIPVGSAAGG